MGLRVRDLLTALFKCSRAPGLLSSEQTDWLHNHINCPKLRVII